MKQTHLLLASSLFSSSLLLASSDSSHTLPSVEVDSTPTGEAIFEESTDGSKSTNVLNKKTLDLLGGPAQTNYLKAIDLMPSVNTQTADAVGISSGQNIKIRGKGSFHIGKTIEDLPITGIVGANGIGGGELFDMENIKELKLYKGAIPSDKGFTLSTSTGVVNANLLPPAKEFGAHIKQTIGTEDFMRTFIRADSGKLSSGSAFALSYSHASGDKWRGEGSSPDAKHNINFAFSQDFGDNITANVYAAYSKIALHNYKTLNYEQASNLGRYYKLDYNAKLGSTAAENAQYYKFNRQEFQSRAILAEIKARLGDSTTLSFKPHFWNEDGFTLSGNGTNLVKWDIRHKQYGTLTKIDSYINDVAFSIGHSFLNMEAPPPPVYRKKYTINNDGSLSNHTYHTLAKQSDNIINTLFLNASKSIDALTISAGVKYLRWKSANLQYFTNTTSIPGNLSYKEALSQAIPDPDQRVNSKIFNRLLPQLWLEYTLTPLLSTALQYSKTYGRPDWGPQADAYRNATPQYKATHTMQDMFDVLKPEMADNFELSLSYNSDKWHLKPILFYSIYKDKELNLYNPQAEQNYMVSNNKAYVYGIEAELAYSPLPQLSLFCSPSYTIAKFNDDTMVAQNLTINTKGNQLPDTPRLLLKAGLIYEHNQLSISPTIRYSGARYGDALNREKIDSYTVVDLHANYTIKDLSFTKELYISASLLNIFNKKYIGIISSSDFNLNGKPSYMAGAPFAAMCSIGAKF